MLPNQEWMRKARRRMLAFLSGIGGLIAAYGTALAFLMLSTRGAA
jgi:hypothetical protein